ncbi:MULTISPECIES: hypothetical protein [Vibrio]|uniref:hypothetical protein n=1 Tax=Vibrio TaxID=662 RepID=UPI0017872A7E|nr:MULTISPECIES: hypothetical protein [Vibrio]EGR2355076.1 hypothetical protein [Vibrio alginolyticus]EIP0121530.1 hypothetical protein [Vibrio alginolyticus]ELE6600270.1 hypothetical protein [Vibrio alginolyticus]MBD1567628.1 hypothetical protein [Vibrio sp. S12_S33]MBS9978395.1 hypothetical protein [Vibrio alginolyticus]
MNIEIISASTALLAVVVGPVVSLVIAKKQIKSSVVSKNRQDWIVSLRAQVSELVSDFQYLPNASIDGVLGREQLIALHRDVLRKCNSVRLHLNLEEKEHFELMEMFDDMSQMLLDYINGKLFIHKEMTGLCNVAIEQCSFVIKIEWEKVKSGR